MNRYLITLLCAGGLFLGSCANDLTVDQTDQGPAPFSPDPTMHLPTPPPSRMGSSGY